MDLASDYRPRVGNYPYGEVISPPVRTTVHSRKEALMSYVYQTLESNERHGIDSLMNAASAEGWTLQSFSVRDRGYTAVMARDDAPADAGKVSDYPADQPDTATDTVTPKRTKKAAETGAEAPAGAEAATSEGQAASTEAA